MSIDLEKLLELAGKATPGNWGTDGHTGVHGESGLLADTCFAHDAAFISAANPAVVTELVNMLKGYLPQPVNHNSTIADFIAKASADLTWLVRQTNGIWPEGDDLIAKDTIDGIGVVLSIAGELAAGWHWFTKAEYLERKAELQHKPSWQEAPAWALYLVQNEIGLWTFTRFEPRPNNAGGWSMDRDVPHHENRLCVNVKDEFGGEVFGDWRDTLERRPADLTIQQAGGAS